MTVTDQADVRLSRHFGVAALEERTDGFRRKGEGKKKKEERRISECNCILSYIVENNKNKTCLNSCTVVIVGDSVSPCLYCLHWGFPREPYAVFLFCLLFFCFSFLIRFLCFEGGWTDMFKCLIRAATT